MRDTIHSANCTVRKGNPEDYEAVFGLIKEFSVFQKNADKVSNTPEQMRASDSLFQCFVAETNGRIVGFASVFFAYYSWSGKALYLDDLYVTDAFRQQGIGSSLLNTVIAYARDNGCHKVRWQVSNWNQNGIAFYKKMGADIDEVEINCDLLL